MNCKNCGANLPEGSAFCGNCGMRVEEQNTYEAPAQTEYQSETYNNYQEQGSYQAPPVQPNYADSMVPVERPNTVLWIVLSAIELLSCCQIAGIISLIFSILGHVSAERGDYADAASKVKAAKISFWIGLGLAVLFIVAYIVLFAIGAFAGMAEAFADPYYYY